MQEAHQKALAAISTLEREIQRLNCTQAHSQLRARSKSGDCTVDQVGKGRGGDAAKSDLQMNPAPSQSADPKMPQGEEGSKGRGSDLEELPELKPTVASFL